MRSILVKITESGARQTGLPAPPPQATRPFRVPRGGRVVRQPYEKRVRGKFGGTWLACSPAHDSKTLHLDCYRRGYRSVTVERIATERSGVGKNQKYQVRALFARPGAGGAIKL